MNKYEGLIILAADVREETLKEAIDKVQASIKAAGGKVETVQKMDQRPFARTSGKRESGVYVNFIFLAPAKAVAELDAKFHLEQAVWRWQITRFEELPPDDPKRPRRRTLEEAPQPARW